MTLMNEDVKTAAIATITEAQKVEEVEVVPEEVEGEPGEEGVVPEGTQEETPKE
jgi:hypothetical protein